jgi:hypothetical protein
MRMQHLSPIGVSGRYDRDFSGRSSCTKVAFLATPNFHGSSVQPACNFRATFMQPSCTIPGTTIIVAVLSLQNTLECCTQLLLPIQTQRSASPISHPSHHNFQSACTQVAARLHASCMEVPCNFHATYPRQKMQLGCNLAEAIVSRSYLPVTSIKFGMHPSRYECLERKPQPSQGRRS